MLSEVSNKQCVSTVAAATPTEQIENGISVSVDEFADEAMEYQRWIDQLEYDSYGIEQNELEMACEPEDETWYHYGITSEDEAVERQRWIDQL